MTDMGTIEDAVWDAYMHAYKLNAAKPGSNSDTQLLAGLMAVYGLGSFDGFTRCKEIVSRKADLSNFVDVIVEKE